jgi:carbon monoxide dehydrogenase subunit G
MLHAGVMAATPLRIRAVIGVLACAAALSAQDALSQALSLETYRQGDAVTVFAGVELQVDPGIVWAVLSDYDHLSDFVPNMRVSRVVSRNGATAIVEQKGEFGLLFFRQQIELKLEITETPKRTIVARAIGGSFREMSGRYDLEDTGRGVKIAYTGRFVPDFPLPPFLGIIAIRHSAATQLGAMVDEILRRDARSRTSR